MGVVVSKSALSARKPTPRRSNGGEHEAVQVLGRQEPGLADPPLDQAPLAVDQLQLEQPQQIARVVDAVAGAFAGHLVILAQHRGQPELLPMMRKQNLRSALARAGGHGIGCGHAACFCSSAASRSQGHAHVGARQMGIGGQVEPGRAPLDPRQDDLPDRISHGAKMDPHR